MSSDGSGSEDHDFEIAGADAGAENQTSIPVNKLKKGGYAILDGHPCRVVDIAKSKTGKHGHAKASIAGTDIFTGRRYEAHLPTSHDLDLSGNTREDVEMPNDEDLANRIQEAFDEGTDEIVVTVLSCGEQSIITEFKRNSSQQQEQEQEQEQ